MSLGVSHNGNLDAERVKSVRKRSCDRVDLNDTKKGREEMNVIDIENNFSDQYHALNNRIFDGSKKKLTIKNFKSRKSVATATEEVSACTLSTIDEDKEWDVMEESVKAILDDLPTKSSLETLFRMVQASCDRTHPKQLYKRLKNLITEYAIKLRDEVESEEPPVLNEDTCFGYLDKFGAVWKVYPVKMGLIRNIFLYLDRIVSSHSNDVEMIPIWETTMRVYREVFFPQINNEFYSIKLFTALYHALQNTMRFCDMTVDVVKELLTMLSTIHIFDNFMSFFLEKIGCYYEEQRKQKVTMNCNEYMRYSYQQVEDYAKVALFNFPDTNSAMRAISKTLIHKLMTCALPGVLENGFDKVLESENPLDVKRMFLLCRKSYNGEEHVRTFFSKYIKERGTKIMSTCQDNDLFQELLTFKNRVNKIVNEGFADSADLTKFRQTLSDSFETFMNTGGNRAAELIARYFHGLLRKCKATDESLDKMLDDAIVLFRFIHGKDVFEAFYKRDLAKRLLLDRSASVDAEKAVLTKLKNECGAVFTQKLEGMFKDMETSEDLNKNFHQHIEHQGLPKANVNVRVLTTDNWPTYDLYEINLPKQMRDSLSTFEEFYRQQHNTRRLNWHYALSGTVLSATFRKGYKKELIMSLHQAVVLLLFNDSEKWTVADIVDATKINKSEVIKTIFSLVGGRGRPRVLKKLSDQSDKKAIETTLETVEKETFVVNSDFNEKLFRIKITQVQLNATKEEKEQVEQEVSQDRQCQIDAAVVRIMKARKNLAHAQLMQELFTQLKFPVKAVDIKARIGSLIDRDYLSRDLDEPNKYNYVA